MKKKMQPSPSGFLVEVDNKSEAPKESKARKPRESKAEPVAEFVPVEVIAHTPEEAPSEEAVAEVAETTPTE